MERLTPSDMAMLLSEDYGWPQDIGALAILDSHELLDGDRMRLDEIRAHVGSRLHLVPRFRQLLLRPRLGLGGPLWVDAPEVDLAHHVRVRPVDPPGDEEQLLEVCEELRRRPFATDRPRWEMWLLPGLADRSIGLYVRVHHAAADGMAGMAALAAFVDTSTEIAAIRDRDPRVPDPLPSAGDLLRDNLTRRAHRLISMLGSLAHPLCLARRVWSELKVMGRVFRAVKAPASSLNQRVGPRRRMALIRGDLEAHREIAHSRSSTVNDLLLAITARGLRDLVASRGEGTPDMVLRAMVPVSLHGTGDTEPNGNSDAGMIIPLPPFGERDPARALGLIAAATAEGKKVRQPSMGTGIFRLPWVQRLGLRLVTRQRLGNVYVANVPGPPFPLYLMGARIRELFPVVPIMGNMTVGIGALSYAGQFNLTLVADADACPDLDVLADGMRRGITEFSGLAASVG